MLVLLGPVGVVLMWVFRRWSVILKVVISVIIIGLWISVISGNQSSTKTRATGTLAEQAASAPTRPAAVSESGNITTASGAVTPSPAATFVVPVPGPVSPTPTEVRYGTRDNPVPVGVYYTLEDHGARLQIRVVDATKNAKAQVKDANVFNEDPPAGSDYLLVKVEARYVAGDFDRPYTTSAGENRLYAENRLWGAPVLSIAPEPSFANNDIFPGATVQGWLPGKYLPTKDMDDAQLQYMGIYFKVGKATGASDQKPEPFSTPDPSKIAGAPVGSRFHPVPFGETYTLDDHGNKIAVKVTQAVLDASKQVHDANMFNADPPSGYSYVLVRTSLKLVQAAGSGPYKTTSDARLYADNRLWGAPELVVGPEPKLEGQDIFQDAIVDGWLPPKYLPKDLEKDALLYYQGVFFALHK